VGRKAGLSDDKLRAVPSDDRTSFNDTERLVIELADAMTDTPANISDDLYARLRKQFSEEQLMQLGADRVRELSCTMEPNFQRRER
jgi:alkylhydroperoxidase family enzyme